MSYYECEAIKPSNNGNQMTISTSLSLTAKLTSIVAKSSKIRNFSDQVALEAEMQELVGATIEHKESGRIRVIAATNSCYEFKYIGKGSASPEFILANYNIIGK